jgi:hypothetical protein
MRIDAKTLLPPLLIAGVLPLAACGGSKDKAEKTVQMKDMEVVDGTATDAMTDLDGVQSEGAQSAMPAANASDNAAVPAATGKTDKSAKATGGDAEVVADQ